MRDAVMSLIWGTAGSSVMFTLIFLVHFCYLTPQRMVQDAVSEKESALSKLANKCSAEAAKERVAKHVKAISDLWAEGKKVLENLLNPDRDLNLVTTDASDSYGKEASDWYRKVVQYLHANGESDDANYFQHCDDGSDQIPDWFPSVLEKRNALCRGTQQTVRNLRVIIDRTKLPS